jgi:hypothetical protein
MYTDASNGTQEADNAINHDIMTYEYTIATRRASQKNASFVQIEYQLTESRHDRGDDGHTVMGELSVRLAA